MEQTRRTRDTAPGHPRYIFQKVALLAFGLSIAGLGGFTPSSALVSLFDTAIAVADSTPVPDDIGQPAADTRRKEAAPSANYNKDRHFLPGEEVVTPTGQKLKVWSTEGPVPVSKAPEPFSDPAKTQLPPNAHVIVDEALIRDRLNGCAVPPAAGTVTGSGDTFAVPSNGKAPNSR